MSDFLNPETDLSRSIATSGDFASFGEIFNAEVENTRLNRYRVEFMRLADELYEQDRQRWKEATGIELVHPMQYTAREMKRGNQEGLFGSSYDRYLQRRERLAKQFPELATQIGAGDPLEPLYAQQRQAEKTAADALDRASGGVDVPVLGRLHAGSVIGGLAGGALDPQFYAENMIGLGGATYRGALGLLWGGVKAAAGNAAATAAFQPLVQDWRRQAGLDYGWAHAGQEVAGAALFGAVVDPVARGAWRGMRSAQGRVPIVDKKGFVTGYRQAGEAEISPASSPTSPATGEPLEALDQAARQADPESLLGKAVREDPDALLEVARQTGAIEDPAVRVAAEKIERERIFGTPPEVESFEHFGKLADAIAHADDISLPPVTDALPALRQAEMRADLSPEAKAARARLEARDGSAIDLALLMRAHPEAVDAGLALNDLRMRQAVSLARLDVDALADVRNGLAPPELGALVAEHVGDPSRQAGLLRALVREGVSSELEAKQFLAEQLYRPGHVGAHVRLHGLAPAGRSLAEHRQAVLEAGLAGALQEPRVKDMLAAAAQKAGMALEGVSTRAQRQADRKELASRFRALVAHLAEMDSHVAELLDLAALALQRGAGERLVLQAFAGRLAQVAADEGTEGLARPRKGLDVPQRGIPEPTGAEAKAQMDALERAQEAVQGDKQPPPLEGLRLAGAEAAAMRGAVEAAIDGLPRQARQRVEQALVFGTDALPGDVHQRLAVVAVGGESGRVMATLRDLGLVSREDWRALEAAATKADILKPEEAGARKAANADEAEAARRAAAVDTLRERRAAGESFGREADTVLDRASAFVEDLRQRLEAAGVRTREDLVAPVERLPDAPHELLRAETERTEFMSDLAEACKA